jgi:hypothetical protein
LAPNIYLLYSVWILHHLTSTIGKWTFWIEENIFLVLSLLTATVGEFVPWYIMFSLCLQCGCLVIGFIILFLPYLLQCPIHYLIPLFTCRLVLYLRKKLIKCYSWNIDWYGAGESVGPIIWEMKYHIEPRRKGIFYCNTKKAGQLDWTHLA